MCNGLGLRVNFRISFYMNRQIKKHLKVLIFQGFFILFQKLI
nr:MAG TPA: hypothetical protein [Caudoviricetes sp.]